MSFSGTKGYPNKPKPGVMLDPLHPLSKGLVGYWLFNEGSGSRVYDISGKNNHGTLKNMVPNVQGSGWGGSKFGGGLQFDGVNDYIDCGNNASLDITNAITMSAWVKPNEYSFNPSWQSIIVKGGSGTTYWFALRTEGTLAFYLDQVYNWNYTTSSVWVANEWQYFVATYDGAHMKLYINGKIIDTVEAAGIIDTATDPLQIGYAEGYPFKSAIDSVQIYNCALSATEVKQLYQNPFCNLLQVPIRRYSVAAPVGAIINQFQKANIGADLYQGAIIA